MTGGVLVLDDSTLDKPYATDVGLVTRHWSGKHHAVVKGINLVTLLATDGDRRVPCDYRVYDKADKKTKNDHFADMVRAAQTRGFQPRCVAFDGWYSSLDNLKLLRPSGWVWLTRLKANRLVSRDRQGTRRLDETAIAAAGTEVWLPGYGLVKVFGIVAPDGDTAYWATSDSAMTELTRLQLAECPGRSRATTAASSNVPGWSGASRGRRGAAEPHRVGAAGVRAVGVLWVHAGRQLGGGQDGDRSEGRPGVPGETLYPPPKTGNCVIPILQTDAGPSRVQVTACGKGIVQMRRMVTLAQLASPPCKSLSGKSCCLFHGFSPVAKLGLRI